MRMAYPFGQVPGADWKQISGPTLTLVDPPSGRQTVAKTGLVSVQKTLKAGQIKILVNATRPQVAQ